MTITVNGHDTVPGCYVAGHHGQYAVDELVMICDQYQIEVDESENIALIRSQIYELELKLSGAHIALRSTINQAIERAYESISWSADALLSRLSDYTDGGYWEWDGGELFLVQTRVDGVVYMVAGSYEEAWRDLVENGRLDCAYTEREPAQDFADDEGLKVFEFAASVSYEPQ